MALSLKITVFFIFYYSSGLALPFTILSTDIFTEIFWGNHLFTCSLY